MSFGYSCYLLLTIAASFFFLPWRDYLPDKTDPEAVCLSTADAIANASVRCYTDAVYEERRQQFIDEIALGSCKSIKRIRDVSALQKQCLPWLQNVPCYILHARKQLPACQKQLLLD